MTADYSTQMNAGILETKKLAGSGIAATWRINIWYETLLIPKDAEFSDFKTLADVKRLGGVLLSETAPSARHSADEIHQPQ